MNESTVAGQFDKAVGKVKESVGEAVGNQKLANSGAADQVKGSAKETWGDVKDAAHEAGKPAPSASYTQTGRAEDDTAQAGHHARESVTSTAENVKNSIHNKLEEFKDNHNR